MITEKIQKALNEQINKEFYSAYLYLSMAAHFESENYQGFAKWMRIQSDEEYMHMLKFYDYLLQTGSKVELEAIAKPTDTWNSPKEIFEAAKEHEIFITNSINSIASLAQEKNDFATLNFLNWFVQEQIEEVATVTTIVEQFNLIGDNKGVLFMLDRELGNRQPAKI